MAERGFEAVAIHEITEAADLGFGTFYNYFDSKEAIHEALVDELFESFGAALDQISEQVDDPAEVISASVRYTLRRASEEPLWGRFLVRVGYWSPVLDRGLAPRVIRDLQTGVASGRFQAHDFPMTILAVRGVVLSAVDASTASPKKGTGDRGFAEIVGAERKSIPERTAAVLLRLLGLDPQEAEEVVSRPLPTIELPPNPLQPPSSIEGTGALR
jgi:AcrR family transcriptional regulator